jgi:GntP family gluconate:H+ symporter
MGASFIQVAFSLLAGIAVIIWLAAKLKLHPFFALMIACFIVGIGTGMPAAAIINTMKEGFGNILRSLGFIIVLGTVLGVILEGNGSTLVMANSILKWLGKKYPALAMSITGLIVGLPIFCDSGFIVLSGLNRTLAKRTGVPAIIMATSMATGLYSVHCLIPPHPGAAAAAGIIGVSYGKLILTGIIVAIPAMIAGYLYAGYAGKKITASSGTMEDAEEMLHRNLPSATAAFLPVIVPVILIALRSMLSSGAKGIEAILVFMGEPVIALLAGVLLALFAQKQWEAAKINLWLQESAEKAGGILVIIGAGGAFGAILAATKIGDHFSAVLPLAGMGLLFPFLITSVLKTAQGSSTVAIITAASIVLPLLPSLGFVTEDQKLLCVLAMGAGSMLVSHANDAYFWVIAKFEKLDMEPMLKVYSVATVLMGLVSLLMVYLLSFILR